MGLSFFKKIDTMDSPLHRVDGRVKTLFFFSAIIAAAILTHWYMAAALWLAGLGTFIILHLPWSSLLRRLYLPWGIAWLVLLSLFFTHGSHPLVTFGVGPFTLTAYREGLQLGILTMLRIMAAVTLACVLSFSTPMIEILETLRLCKVPGIMVDLAAMMYRYIFILEETAHNMRRAQLCRMGGRLSWLKQVGDAGKIAAAVLLKSMDRSITIYKAMLARGYNENSSNGSFFTAPLSVPERRRGFLAVFLLVLFVAADIMLGK